MIEKTIKEFVKEMREVFGDDQLEVCVWGPDGQVLTKTKNWVDEELFIKQEKLMRLKLANESKANNGYRYKTK
jgi:hypothetical protein